MKTAQLMYADGEQELVHLDVLQPLGHGRAFQGYLVKPASGRYAGMPVVEKASRPDAITDLLYAAAFQAPHAYKRPPVVDCYGDVRQHAMRAALYRRKVLRDLTEATFGKPLIADAYYTRWDDETRSNVLGTEYIEGRGVIPGQRYGSPDRQPWEIDRLVEQMKRMRELFDESGFFGSEWQVDPDVLVTTSNFRVNPESDFICHDLESGSPAFFPRYLIMAAKTGFAPMFDDIDAEQLKHYLKNKRAEISDRLGPVRCDALLENAEALEYHATRWKEGEPAVMRHRGRLVSNRPSDRFLRSNIRYNMIETWKASGLVTSDEAEDLRRSGIKFGYKIAEDAFWQAYSGLSSAFDSIGKSMVSVWNKFLKKVPRAFYSAFFDEKYLNRLTEGYIEGEIDKWHDMGRISAEEAYRLKEYAQSDPWIREYMKCFLAQWDLKVLDPPIIGDAMTVYLAQKCGITTAAIPVAVSPVIRSIYTISRMIKNRDIGHYIVPFLIGALPKAGDWAYPLHIGLYATAAERDDFSEFLTRSTASKIGRHIPIIGGEGTRTEHFFMKCADVTRSLLRPRKRTAA